MKYGKVLVVIVGLLVLGTIIVVDLRPTSWLRTLFFRYYYLERLNQFTKITDPIMELIYRPKQSLKTIKMTIDPTDIEKMIGSLPPPYPAEFLSSQDAPPVHVQPERGIHAFRYRRPL